MTDQGSFFEPNDYKVAWTTEEMKPEMDDLRAKARNRQLERVRLHNQVASNRISSGFNDRREKAWQEKKWS